MISLTAVVLTYNERENIGRTLKALQWVPRVLLVDSLSSDGTLEIAKGMRPDLAIAQHVFESFAQQCNFALTLVETEWVLSIDADYIVTPELAQEVQALVPSPEVAGYSAAFHYCVYGRRLRSTIYPPRTVLYRRTAAVYRNEGHGHRVSVAGEVRPLAGNIDHDDRKPLSRWLNSQDGYTRIEAAHLLSISNATLPLQDRLRKKIFIAPIAMPLLLLFGRGLILDGWQGWFYVAQRTIAELLLSVRLLIEKYELEKPSR